MRQASANLVETSNPSRLFEPAFVWTLHDHQPLILGCVEFLNSDMGPYRGLNNVVTEFTDHREENSAVLARDRIYPPRCFVVKVLQTVVTTAHEKSVNGAHVTQKKVV